MKMNWSKIVRLSLGGSMVAAFLCSSLQRAEAAVIAQYPFTGSSFASTDTDPDSSAGDITLVGLTHSSFNTGFGNPAPSFQMSTSDIGNTFNPSVYFQFTVTAVNGMSLTSLTFDTSAADATRTGHWAVRSGAFTTDLATGTISGTGFTGSSVDLTGGAFDGLTTVTFRVYGWDDSPPPDLLFDNVVLSGTVVPVPEPINVALGVFGLCVAGAGVGRRYLLKRS